VKDELTNGSVQSMWDNERLTYKQINLIFITPGDDLINKSDQFPYRNERWGYKHISSIFIDLED
jgi:hypothetical protein